MGGMGGPGMFGGQPPMFGMPPQQPPAPAAPPAATKPSQFGGYVPPADGKGGGQVLIKSVNGKVVITPIPGTGDNPPLTSAPAAPTTATKTAVKPAAAAPSVVKQAAPAVKKTPAAAPSSKPAVTNGSAINGNNIMANGNNNNEMSKENNAGAVNGSVTDDNVKKGLKHKSPELDDYNSIFDPRSMENDGGMDAADREIEQFKLFCRDSVPVQNRTKVSFDVRNIAFKKKM